MRVQTWLRWSCAYVFGLGIPLEIRLDRLVLLVELGHIGDQILDDVCVWQRVDTGLLSGIGGDTAYPSLLISKPP